ncbi:acetyltransferase [Pseudoalteromonas ruthenica]|uniref:acetyltransferase n=1 Tax=Pseudoalteromonas ruthenica TaxID=151081 RepID=UPI00110AB342|nr:acetyltransferase [Pseudoalteromonas ruthenica]TMO45002.1 acyltransferase [Pseudoalteromonas ruthenica]TMO49078.1 acyltransferase [Pseudoalteromonas ruthenica]
MLKRFLPNWLAGILAGCVLLVNTLVWGVIVFLLGLVKLVLPLHVVTVLLHSAYNGWRGGNRLGLKIGCENFDVSFNGEVQKGAWYLLISNHLSWLDIVVLSAVNELPAPKFFLKDELKYVPLIGSGAWAMGMPFMKRASKEQIAKNPKLKGMDVERTKRSCHNFKQYPSCIVNFVEGSRFTASKHQRQESPFRHLLKPKAGGIAFALQVLGEQFDGLLDATLHYQSQSSHICRDFLTGRLTHIELSVEVREIAPQLVGDYQQDKAFRVEFQKHLNVMWHQKDALIAHNHAPVTEVCPDVANSTGEL